MEPRTRLEQRAIEMLERGEVITDLLRDVLIEMQIRAMETAQ